jgi:hypothetical protein
MLAVVAAPHSGPPGAYTSSSTRAALMVATVAWSRPTGLRECVHKVGVDPGHGTLRCTSFYLGHRWETVPHLKSLSGNLQVVSLAKMCHKSEHDLDPLIGVALIYFRCIYGQRQVIMFQLYYSDAPS